eukprot:scaffold9870_cov47-Phaeocystis_antarctica.AAC.1
MHARYGATHDATHPVMHHAPCTMHCTAPCDALCDAPRHALYTAMQCDARAACLRRGGQPNPNLNPKP